MYTCHASRFDTFDTTPVENWPSVEIVTCVLHLEESFESIHAVAGGQSDTQAADRNNTSHSGDDRLFHTYETVQYTTLLNVHLWNNLPRSLRLVTISPVSNVYWRHICFVLRITVIRNEHVLLDYLVILSIHNNTLIYWHLFIVT